MLPPVSFGKTGTNFSRNRSSISHDREHSAISRKRKPHETELRWIIWEFAFYVILDMHYTSHFLSPQKHYSVLGFFQVLVSYHLSSRQHHRHTVALFCSHSETQSLILDTLKLTLYKTFLGEYGNNVQVWVCVCCKVSKTQS